MSNPPLISKEVSDLAASLVAPTLDRLFRDLVKHDLAVVAMKASAFDATGIPRLAISPADIGDLTEEILSGPSFMGSSHSKLEWTLLAHWFGDASKKLKRIAQEVVHHEVMAGLIDHCDRHCSSAHQLAGVRHAS